MFLRAENVQKPPEYKIFRSREISLTISVSFDKIVTETLQKIITILFSTNFNKIRRTAMKKLVALLMMTVMMFALAGCGGGDKKEEKAAADKKIVLKLSHVFSPDEQLYKSMEMVAERINKKTNGRVEIQCYGQNQLACYKDGLEQVAHGANFISVEDPSYLGDYVADFKPLVGPMLYQSYDEYAKMIETPLVKDMIAKAEDKGIKVLALDYVFGFRNMITNKEINTPADLQGMKIRTPGSKLFIDTINAMGATATSLPFSETLSGVSQGVVDGLEGSEFTNIGTKCYEYAKNVSTTKHFLGTCGVYISTKVWDKISPEDQKIIAEEFAYGGKEMTKISSESYDKVYKELESKGVKFNDVDHVAFEKATEVVFKNMEEKEGATPGIHEKLKAELVKIRAAK